MEERENEKKNSVANQFIIFLFFKILWKDSEGRKLKKMEKSLKVKIREIVNMKQTMSSSLKKKEIKIGEWDHDGVSDGVMMIVSYVS